MPFGIRVSSLYAEIGADTTGVKRGLEETKRGLERSKTDFSGLANAAGKAFAFIGAEAVLLKKAFDFGKEGAQIEFVESKFDRLAASIGTTGDVLEQDLKAATRGMVSDMDLLTSATDFMSLGLVHSREEAVRLTRVAGALNMNMNQLVLTLTNQTTMRFDALGVAVEGFDDKVKALEKTGLSTQDAFTEAFLRQAEDQIDKVGEAADSAVAPFQRLEVATTNLGNEAKRTLVPILADAADALYLLLTRTEQINTALAGHAAEVQDTAKSYEEYSKELERAAGVAGYTIDEFGNLVQIMDSGLGATQKKLIQENYRLTESEYDLAEGAIAQYEAMRDASIGMQDSAQDAEAAAAAADKFKERTDALAEAQAGLLEELGKIREQNIADFFDVDMNVGDVAAKMFDVVAFKEAGGQALEGYLDTVKAGLAENKLTTDQAKTFFENIAVEAAAIQVDIGNIDLDAAAKEISDQFNIPLEEARGRIDDVIGGMDEINASDISQAMEQVQSLQDRSDELAKAEGYDLIFNADPGDIAYTTISNLSDEIMAIEGVHEINFVITTTGSVPDTGTPDTSQAGGSFVVPAGFSGGGFPIFARSGEMVTVAPSAQNAGGGGGGDIYVNQHFYNEGAAALGMALVTERNRARLRASAGVG